MKFGDFNVEDQNDIDGSLSLEPAVHLVNFTEVRHHVTDNDDEFIILQFTGENQEGHEAIHEHWMKMTSKTQSQIEYALKSCAHALFQIRRDAKAFQKAINEAGDSNEKLALKLEEFRKDAEAIAMKIKLKQTVWQGKTRTTLDFTDRPCCDVANGTKLKFNPDVDIQKAPADSGAGAGGGGGTYTPPAAGGGFPGGV